MAYITQYESDMQGDVRNRQNQAAIGNALVSGIQAINENRRRAVDEGRKKFTQDMQYAALGVAPTEAEGKEVQDTGYSKSLLERLSEPLKAIKDRELVIANAKNKKALYDAEQLTKPVQQRDDYIKSMDTATAKAEMTSNIVADRMDKQEQNRIEAEKRKLENDKTNSLQKVAINDYDFHSPDIIPSTKDAESVKKMSAAHTNFERTAKEIQDLLGSMDKLDYTGMTDKGKLLKQKISEAQIQQKTIKDLGVLNGPDLPLINNTLGDVGSMTSLMTLGPDAAKSRMQDAVNSSKNNLQSEASARGYKPKAKAQAKQFDPKHVDAVKSMSDADLMKIINGGV